MSTKAVIGKVPGTVKAGKDVYIENLSKYTFAQLCDLRDRQTKLLVNKWVNEL